jgi:hypothetical protein
MTHEPGARIAPPQPQPHWSAHVDAQRLAAVHHQRGLELREAFPLASASSRQQGQQGGLHARQGVP